MDLAPEVKDVFYGSVQELNRRVLPNLTYDPLASYDLATYQEGMYGSLITDLRSKCVSTGQKIYCLMWLYILVMLLILLLVVLIVICCYLTLPPYRRSGSSFLATLWFHRSGWSGVIKDFSA